MTGSKRHSGSNALQRAVPRLVRQPQGNDRNAPPQPLMAFLWPRIIPTEQGWKSLDAYALSQLFAKGAKLLCAASLLCAWRSALRVQVRHQKICGAVISQRVDPQAVDHSAVWSPRAAGVAM